MKKKIAACLLGIGAAFALTACGSAASSGNAGATPAGSPQRPASMSTEEKEGASSENQAGQTEKVPGNSDISTGSTAESGTSDSGALIIYFDYSENMGDTSGMSLDAVTSASLAGESYDGIERNDLLVMKDEIQKQTGADVYSVRVTDPYDPDYGKMVNVAQDDQNDNKTFEFRQELPDLSGYTTIYLGMPVWWGQLPQPMASFLAQHDFSGKTIIPFGIHLGSRFGRMVDQIQQLQPDADVSENGLTENSHTPNAEVVQDVDAWLEQ